MSIQKKKTVYERKCHYENKTKEAKRFLLIQLMLKKPNYLIYVC